MNARKKRRPILKAAYAGLAACAVTAVVLIAVLTGPGPAEPFVLESSGGAVVTYLQEAAPAMSSSYELVPLTERQILGLDPWSGEPSARKFSIIRGTVEEIRNIMISFGEGREEYRAVASIKTAQSYAGSAAVGDIVKILLPCPIDEEGFWVEDTGVISQVREGMEGVFIALEYDDSSVLTENGKSLYLKEISDCGLTDGVRFAFLETDSGLVYSRRDFPSASGMRTLDEVEEYIRHMQAQG